jgi:hypothetical protein
MGAFNPSGRLASSVYYNAEKVYVTRKTGTEHDGLKIGNFLGYRYYDTSKEFSGYPFGHGLSYTKFSYGSLFVGKESVVFTVKNRGKRAGAEIAQLYIGCDCKGYPRPEKQLCGFARVELKPGQTKVVEIPYKLPVAYDKTGNTVEEKGRYTVYVGASVSDIRLRRVVYGGTVSVKEKGEDVCRYVHTKSNIISDNFKLEAKTDIMKKSVFNFIMGAGALVLALALKMYCIFMGVENSVLDIFAAVIAISGMVFFIVEGARRSRVRSEERRRIEKLTIEEFKKAEQMKAYAAKQSQEAQSSVKNFGDRINPDAAKDPRAAAAEEAILGLMLMREEYRSAVASGEIPLAASDFVTDFHRRVFESLLRMHQSEIGFRFELLGTDFSPDEVGRIEKMEVSRQELSENGPTVFRSAVSVLQEASRKNTLENSDLNTRLAYLREKKAKLHKGKVEET